MPETKTYVEGVQAIRDARSHYGLSGQPLCTLKSGLNVVRPLTFKEKLEVRAEERA